MGTAIYNIYFHPLSKFPGPKSAAATPIPFVRRIISGDIFPWTLSLHQKYGEIVRIHPDELSIVAPAWHDIYATRPPLPKPDVGTLRTQNKTPSLVTARSMKEHDRMRLVLSHGFSERALKEQEPIIQIFVDLLIAQLLNKTIASGEQGVATLNIGE